MGVVLRLFGSTDTRPGTTQLEDIGQQASEASTYHIISKAISI